MLAFRQYETVSVPPPSPDQSRYAMLWSWVAGTWSYDAWSAHRQPWDAPLYGGTRQIWRSASAIVDFYDQLVYKGDLSTNGEPLSDGTRGAIPIDPQTGNEASDEALVIAIHQLFQMWRFQQKMSQVPMLCAALGDCLVEIIDDYPHGKVFPRIVWPGYVPDCDLVLDDDNNIKRYAIEYPVTIESSTAFGKPVMGEQYMFRKEVDSESYRYYKDGKEFEYPDLGKAVQRNPYGFAPAVWERHKQIPWQNRGISAIEQTIHQALQLNATLSHALDYQSKQFAIPVGVVGSAMVPQRGTGRIVTLPGGVTVTFPGETEPTLEQIAEAKRQLQEQQNLIGMTPDGKFVTAEFSTGDTSQILQLVLDSTLSESPEARYAQEVMQLSQATGPGMERLLTPIVGKIEAARKQHDPQLEKMIQMAITIMGYRIKNGDMPPDIIRNRSDRMKAFASFDLESYGKGLQDFTIPGRPVFPETPLEKAQRMVLVQQVTDPDLMLELGRDEEVVNQLTAERKAQAEREAAMLTGFDSGNEQDSGPTGPTGRSGPSGATGVRAA